MVNAVDYIQFVPSNPWVAVGWRDREAITFQIRPHFEKKDIAFVAQPVTRIDAEGNALELADGSRLEYDHLVVTIGPKLSFDEVPGAGPRGHTQSICTIDHAEQTRENYQRFLADPVQAIIGAMPFASCFGPACEFSFIFNTDLKRRKLRSKVPITFVTSEPCVGHMGLGGMDPVSAAEVLCNPSGFVLIDEFQRSKKYRNIHSAGVCVAIPPVEATPVPTGAPKTGYMIETMVTAIVHNIASDPAGQPATAKGSWNAICLADMGDTGMAFVAMPQIPPRNVNWFQKGKWVHLAKVAFEKYFNDKMKNGTSEPTYEKYIFKMIGLERIER
ncbi:MAG: NAD(P)/FAD-dependent oxidoreductase [Ideonella sp.]